MLTRNKDKKLTAKKKIPKPFFVLNLKDNNKECQQIKIYPNSNPSELAFNFCKENNLDFNALKFIKTNIKRVLQKFQINKSKSNRETKNNSIKEEKTNNENIYFPKKNSKNKKMNVNLKIYQIPPKQKEINEKIKKIQITSQNIYHTISNMSIPNELINNHENKETYNYIIKKSIPNNYSFDINDNSSENGVPVLDDSFSNESNGKNIWTFIDNEKEYEEENNIKNKINIKSLDIITDCISNNNRYDYESSLRLKFNSLNNNNKKEYYTCRKKKSLSLTPLIHQEKKSKNHMKPINKLQTIENLQKKIKKQENSKKKVSSKKVNNNFAKIKNHCFQTPPINNTTLSLQFIGSVIMSNLGKKIKNQLNEDKVKNTQISKSVSDLVDFMNNKIFPSHNNIKYQTYKNSQSTNYKNKEKKSNNNHIKNLCLKKYTNTIIKNKNNFLYEKKNLSNTINYNTTNKKINDKTYQEFLANSNEKINLDKKTLTTRRNHNSISKPNNISINRIRKRIEKLYNIHKILLQDNKSRNNNKDCESNKKFTSYKTGDVRKKLIKKFKSNHSSRMSTQKNTIPNNNQNNNQNNDIKHNNDILYNLFDEIYFILSKNKKTISLNEPYITKIHKLSPELKKIIIKMINIIQQSKKIINRNDFIHEMMYIYKYNLNSDMKKKLILFKKDIDKIAQGNIKHDGFYYPISSSNRASIISNDSRSKSNSKYYSSKGKNFYVK